MTRNLRTAFIALLFVPLMLGLSYAAVPLYDIFCRVTGYGGTTQRADVLPDVPYVGRQITVRFDANRNRNLPWDFTAPVESVTLSVGTSGLVFFHARNFSTRPITGTASFNVTPAEAGLYFSKIDCFCFTEQTLYPDEEVDLPVSFFIDPAIVEDHGLQFLDTITLSYTFFESTQ